MSVPGGTELVLDTAPLGPQWPTVDPFLFCAHHHDEYPRGDGTLAPAASLDGRDLGADFAGVDGWNMYHGEHVPGFPQHPHRGFETITYVRRGLIDHSDSMGAQARFGAGDTQWLTAGSGIVHCEMFPLVHDDRPNPLELFQIWLNLPASDKMVDPYFTMLWAEELPVIEQVGASITVVTGRLADANPPTPPNSWAAHDDAEVAVWHVRLDAGARFVLPPASEGVVRTIYCFDGNGVGIGAHSLRAKTCAVVRADVACPLVAEAGPVECLVLQGRPLNEPVARYGPFVMNTRAEIQQAFEDYERTGFGGWQWHVPDPNHGDVTTARFARYPDGSVVEPSR